MMDERTVRCPDCGSAWVQPAEFSAVVWECRYCQSLFRLGHVSVANHMTEK